jgi:hypothetical protein
MNIFTSQQAKDQLPMYTFEEMRQCLDELDYPSNELYTTIGYLIYMCQRGELDSVKELLQRLPYTEANVIINTTTGLCYNGTILHEALYWNSGELGLAFFNLFRSYGAEYKKNTYEEFPWEQGGPLWVNTLMISRIGLREENEFSGLYNQIRSMVRYSEEMTG